jgi:Zn finger protein HypA/HybF involved in hydrogenase expression
MTTVDTELEDQTPEEADCEDCGNTYPYEMLDSDGYCERCLEEAAQVIRDQNWDYYHS